MNSGERLQNAIVELGGAVGERLDRAKNGEAITDAERILCEHAVLLLQHVTHARPEAREHCNRSDTANDAWFDGYVEEKGE